MFCHKTPESPRCHVEALISGCPIIGYESSFAAELTRDGGSILVPLGNKQQLADEICKLHTDRQRLVMLVQAAAQSGKRFNDVAVFEHRSNLIKKHL
jgi:glycosyltransferase involved in cell wall biosynthesis